MKIECPSCKKIGHIDNSKLPELGVYATCPQCNTQFLVKKEEPKDFVFNPVQEKQSIEVNSDLVIGLKKQKPSDSIDYLRLYRIAVGEKGETYYVPIFKDFITAGKISTSWNGLAFVGGPLWCFYRRMNLIGFIYLAIAMVSYGLSNMGRPATITGQVIALISAYTLGDYGNAIYFNHINKKIRSLQNVTNDYNSLSSMLIKKTKVATWILYGFIGFVVIGIIAAIAIPQFTKDTVTVAPIAAPASHTTAPPSGNPKPFHRLYLENKALAIDSDTNLMWPTDGNLAGRPMEWGEALRWTQNLNYGGYSDWRLPNRQELMTLRGQGGSRPFEWFNTNGFANVQPGGYLDSSETVSDGMTWHGIVWFGDDYTENKSTSSGSYVWPVRGGQ